MTIRMREISENFVVRLYPVFVPCDFFAVMAGRRFLAITQELNNANSNI